MLRKGQYAQYGQYLMVVGYWGTVRCMLDGSLSLMGISGIWHACLQQRAGVIGGVQMDYQALVQNNADDRLTGDLLVGRCPSRISR